MDTERARRSSKLIAWTLQALMRSPAGALARNFGFGGSDMTALLHSFGVAQSVPFAFCRAVGSKCDAFGWLVWKCVLAHGPGLRTGSVGGVRSEGRRAFLRPNW